MDSPSVSLSVATHHLPMSHPVGQSQKEDKLLVPCAPHLVVQNLSVRKVSKWRGPDSISSKFLRLF